MRRSFKYRLYPTRLQSEKLQSLLDAGRTLYNLALEQRRDAWKTRKLSLNYYDQSTAQLKEVRDAFPQLSVLNYSACQDVLHRLQKSFDGFFRRIKVGQAGFPRFKGRDRFNSITFPAYGDGVKLIGKLRVQNVGLLRIKLHRQVQGTIKTVTLKREGVKWYAVFSCDNVPVRSFPVTTASVGVDVGSRSFAVDSTGLITANPKFLKQSADLIRRRARRLARRKKGSHRRVKARLLLAKAHEKVADQRRDFLHKLANYYIRNYKTICVEDLDISGMVRNIKGNGRYISKSITDAGWGLFFQMLSYKAEEAGREIVKVPPKGTTETCFRCGTPVPKAVHVRLHRCPSCNLKIGRDLNAALNLQRLGRSLQASTRADVRPNVA